ncbi:hypothetical protein Agub_g14119 [Astrephomene gubernaculifera]|uniref:GATA-type domain-containing protein n=1 Tax=Astrephomene gubernaculifera TaxID=47775 RepID=A0AAD3E574_9CHLO|nr:hypothetical protein Agub_g14119 [Astrephomene gubernaculifera]
MRGSSGASHVCAHCGTTQTPCWRKGPPEKPTLCNACGSRYLVKGTLAGYFPGARRSSANTARSEIPQMHHAVVVTKGSRKGALPAAEGHKRKERDFDGYEGQAQRIFNDYEALEQLRYSLLFGAPVLIGNGAVAATASDSSAEGQPHEDCFRRESHYLDASSDEYPETVQNVAPNPFPATATTGISGPRPAMFHRRPRKQLRPVACSC